MNQFLRPYFIKKSGDFSLIYFQQTNKFLLAFGRLSKVFEDSTGLDTSQYNQLCCGLIAENTAIKSCISKPKNTAEDSEGLHDLNKPTLDSCNITAVLKLSSIMVEVKFDLPVTKQVFLARYAHLELKREPSFFGSRLTITQGQNYLGLFEGKTLLAKSLKTNYHELQSQFGNRLIEYYHGLSTSEWLCSLHACAVKKNEKTLLILGNSGAGKSTLTALLCAHGYRFIGDDLILMDADLNIYDNPGALSVKQNAWAVVDQNFKEFPMIKPSSMTKGGTKMKYLPIHFIQENKPQKHKTTALIWVHYSHPAKTQLMPLSSADVCAKLIPETWVNPESRYPEVFAQWLLNARGFELTYSNFNTVIPILDEQV